MYSSGLLPRTVSSSPAYEAYQSYCFPLLSRVSPSSSTRPSGTRARGIAVHFVPFSTRLSHLVSRLPHLVLCPSNLSHHILFWMTNTSRSRYLSYTPRDFVFVA